MGWCDFGDSLRDSYLEVSGMNDAWHKEMYDRYFASSTIGSRRFRMLAVKEAKSLIRVLGLKAGDSILDVPCGTGRHAAVFAKHGLRVTGIDISKACLQLAREECRGRPVSLSQGDMARLSEHRNRYDAVVNLFSSFGYFATDSKNEQVLRELVSTLKPGGQIAIHLINRDWLLKVFRPVDWRIEGSKFILEGRKYDQNTHYNEAQVAVIDQRTGKGKVYHHRMRLYSKLEMTALMRKCGLVDIRVLGNFDGDQFSRTGSSHPIYIARRRSKAS